MKLFMINKILLVKIELEAEKLWRLHYLYLNECVPKMNILQNSPDKNLIYYVLFQPENWQFKFQKSLKDSKMSRMNIEYAQSMVEHPCIFKFEN